MRSRTAMAFALVLATLTAAAASTELVRRADDAPKSAHIELADTPEGSDDSEAAAEADEIVAESSKASSGPDFSIACDDLGPQGPIGTTGSLAAICTVHSIRAFEGTVDMSCAGAAWLRCDFISDGIHVEAGKSAPARADVRITGASPGKASFEVVGTHVGIQRTATLAFVVEGTGVATDVGMPSFDCDAWSALIQPGGVKRIGCHIDPAAFPGHIYMHCGEDPQGQDCRAEPAQFNLTGKHDRIPFELVITTLYSTPPSTYTETVRMGGGSLQKESFQVVVPAVIGTVSILCPPTVVAKAGDVKVPCAITSLDGFDGNLNLQGFTPFAGGNMRILVADPVRVPLHQTITAHLTLRSTAVPPEPVRMVIDVQPEHYVAEEFSFEVSPPT